MRVTFKTTDLKCLCPRLSVSYRFHVAQADLPKVAMQLKMILNSYIHVPGTGITGMCHCAQLFW